MRRKLFFVLILALVFAVPAYSASLQATIGGKNSSGNYQYTVDSDGVMTGNDSSTIILEDGNLTVGDTTLDSSTFTLNGIERSGFNPTYTIKTDATPSTVYTLTSSSYDTVFINKTSSSAIYLLPNCDSYPWEIGFVSATTQTIRVVPYSGDTIVDLTLDSGDALTSPATTQLESTSASLKVRCFTTNYIVPVSRAGTWTDSGAY